MDAWPMVEPVLLHPETCLIPRKKITWKGDRQTYWHRDSMIKSAQWADSMKIGKRLGHFPYPIPNVKKSFPLMPEICVYFNKNGWKKTLPHRCFEPYLNQSYQSFRFQFLIQKYFVCTTWDLSSSFTHCKLSMQPWYNYRQAEHNFST